MAKVNSDHDLVEDVIIAPKPAWRTPRAESYEQENQRMEDEMRKTPKGRADQKKRGLK